MVAFALYSPKLYFLSEISSIKVVVVAVPDGVILPAVAFAAVAVYTFSVK